MLQPLNEHVLDFREHLAMRRERGGAVGYSTGLKAIDYYGGAEPGLLAIVGGRPGMGKSALIETIQWNVAKEAYLLNKKYPDEKPWCVLGFSFEQHSRVLLRRQAFRMLQLSHQDWKQGTLSDEEYDAIDQAVLKLERLPVFFDIASDTTVRQIIDDVKEISKHWRIRFVWQDFIQRLKEIRALKDRYQGIGDAAQEFSDLAKDLDFPFWALAQLKKSEDGKAARPTKEDLFGATMVEGAVRSLYLLHREDVYHTSNPLYEPTGKVELITDKNNDGELGLKYLAFDGPTVSYKDWEG